MPNVHWLDTWADAANVNKANVRNGFRDYVIWSGSVAQLQAATMSGCLLAAVKSSTSIRLYYLDAADGSSADNGSTVLVSADGGRYKLHTGAREVLTANRTYYVSTTGNDSNHGLTAGAPMATVSGVWNKLLKLDLNGYTVTISLAAGTYTAGGSLSGQLVGSRDASSVVINGSGISSTIINATSYGFTAAGGAAFTIQNLKIITSGIAVHAQNGGLINLGSGIDFGASTSAHMRCDLGGQIKNNYGSTYTISGGAAYHVYANGGLVILSGCTITVTGTPAFSFFAYITVGASFNAFGHTYTGAATGTRYSVALNGVINTFGGGASYFPGSVAGSTATGGQYA